MKTSQNTIDYLLDQLSSLPNVRARKMFGEYALYCDEKVVALVYDNQLFVKITPPVSNFLKNLFKKPTGPTQLVIPCLATSTLSLVTRLRLASKR